MRNYTFRRLTKADLPLMRRWLETAHVKVWWPNAEQQVALMKQDMNDPEIDMWVVNLIDHPFAYMHDHSSQSFGMPEFADLPYGSRVISTFVGDHDFMGQGHATGYVEARVRELRRQYPMVAVSVDTTDTRSIGVFRQAGFLPRRLASTREGRLVQVLTHL